MAAKSPDDNSHRADQWLRDRVRCLPTPAQGGGSAAELYPTALASRDARRLFDDAIRTSLEVVKFVPEYRDRWMELARCYPDDAAYLALKQMRSGKPASPAPLNAALLHLAGFPLLGLLGPVDPTREADFPPLRAWHPDPPHGWLTHYLGVTEVETPTLRERIRKLPSAVSWWGWTAELEVDLRYSNSALSVALAMLREDRQRAAPEGMPIPWQDREPLHETAWAGPRGWRASLWLLRQKQWGGKRKDNAQLAADYLAELRRWGSTSERPARNPTRRAKRRGRSAGPSSISEAIRDVPPLLARARRRVREARRGLGFDPVWTAAWTELLGKCRTRRT